MGDVPKSAVMTISRYLEPPRTVTEELGGLDIVFPLDFGEKHFREHIRPPWIWANMKNMVGFRFDGGVQSELSSLTRITVLERAT